MSTHNYNAHHSPIGAFASFTLGFRGAKGGLGLELEGPANHNVYIGVEDDKRVFDLLPFFDCSADGDEEARRYDVEGQSGGANMDAHVGHSEDAPLLPPVRLRALDQSTLERHFNLTTDTWIAPGFDFTIYSPVRAVPDPATASDEVLKAALAPAVLCELTVDNSNGRQSRRAVFGYAGNDPYWGTRRLDDTAEGKFVGLGEGNHLAIVSRDEGVASALGFGINDVLDETLPENYAFGLGKCAVLLCDVPAGEKRTFRFAVCFHRSGIATAGLGMTYFYTRFFPDIESVAAYALDNFEVLRNAALQDNELAENAALSDDQKWMFCHAVRSYYGSTEVLEYEGEPVWVVNEGEYRMMNTFDLTADHLFWELRQNPWAVKNQLDWFVDLYSYQDMVRFPGDKREYSGGLSFTHDMGVANVWSRPEYSSYEKQGLTGCFSYMTHEQLVNWICCAATGWKLSSTADNSWLSKIYLCQFVARQILGRESDEIDRRADAEHVAWLLDERNAYFAWSDQMVAGVAEGSKYYPRGVTSALWLLEKNNTRMETNQLKTSELGTSWIEFTAFEYCGRDKVADELALSDGEFLNPILAGFYADPSICRAGDDFYLVNSSFSYYPGVPIFHSTDLVNWTQLGFVLDRPSQLDLDGLGVSRGIFAPDISYHDGVFYMVTTNVDGGNNFYVTAQNPAGPWSEPIWLPQVDGIDPSLFFDEDGHAYLVHNGPPPNGKPLYDGHRAIWVWEFDPQAGTVKNGRIVVNGGVDISQKPIWIEGPHIFKRNGFYYLCAAEGGTSVQHSQVIFRTKSLDEPFEPFSENPILTQRDLDAARPNPITSVGHADFVETPSGEWWAVFLGCRPYEDNFYNIGRETFLLPVTWENDWPLILERGQTVPRVLRRPDLPAPPQSQSPLTGSFSWRDDFDDSELGHAWNFLRTPREIWWSLTARPGSLLIAPRAVGLNSSARKNRSANGNPSFIARRQQHLDFSATSTLAVNPETAPSEAGLAALQNDANYFFLGVRVDEGMARQVFLERHTEKSTGPEMLASAILPDGTNQIELRIEGAGREYSFSYRSADSDWIFLKENLDGSILSTEAAGGFVGTYLGMFARKI